MKTIDPAAGRGRIGTPRGAPASLAAGLLGLALLAAACLQPPLAAATEAPEAIATTTAAAGAPLGTPADPLRLLAFGDSLTHGYGLPAGETFPAQLEAALRAEGHAVEVLNGGNSGDTTAAGLARLDWALAERPDAVLVELGANDGLRGIDPGNTRENLDAILTRLDALGLPVLLAGMFAPRNLGADYTEAFDAVFPTLAEKHGVALYPFFLDGVAMVAALNQDDGIHPNAKGVAVIVERILPEVVALLESAKPGQALQDRGAREPDADG